MLKTLHAVGDFITHRFSDLPVIVTYAYRWNEEEEAKTGEKIVVQCFGGSAEGAASPGSQTNTARGAWCETMSFLVTYVKPIKSQNNATIAGAAAKAERIFPIFRKQNLPGLDVRWVGTTRIEPYHKSLINGAGLFRVPFVVSYRADHMEE